MYIYVLCYEFFWWLKVVQCEFVSIILSYFLFLMS